MAAMLDGRGHCPDLYTIATWCGGGRGGETGSPRVIHSQLKLFSRDLYIQQVGQPICSWLHYIQLGLKVLPPFNQFM
jgi:hypothetical protein